MPKFAEDLALAVRDIMKNPEVLARLQYPAASRIFWVKASSATGYDDFVAQHPAYEDAVPAVYTTITAGVAALSDYDVLIIAPGNYDEAGVVSLDDLKGVKIIGDNNGMTWGEGSTCWRQIAATHTTNILEMSGNQSIEFSGVNFIATTNTVEGVKFDGLNYGIHFHHCRFTGNVGASDTMLYGINAAGANGPDLYVHHCMFDRIKTTAIIPGHQRNVIEHNVFIVGSACTGIVLPGSTTASFNVVKDNYFLGNSGANSKGITSAAVTTGNFLIANNIFGGFNVARCIVVHADGDTICVNNYCQGADGVITAVNPST